MFNSTKKYDKHTFFEFEAYGKAVVFNPDKLYRFSSKKRIKGIAKRIQKALSELSKSNYLIGDYEGNEAHYNSCTEAIETMFWDPILYNKILMHRKEEKCSFKSLYDKSLEDLIGRIKSNLVVSYIGQEGVDQAESFIRSSDEQIKKIIYRELLRESLERYKEPIILIVDKFYKEYLYNLSPYVKGFVIRDAYDKDEIVEFAYAYEIPMVESDVQIKNGDRIIIDNYHDALIVNPKRNVYNEKKKTINQLIYKEEDIAPYKMTRIKFYVPLVDTRYLDVASNHTYYEGLGMYRSEYYYMVKGMLPSVEELTLEYIEILDAFRRKEVIFRIPDFGEYKVLDYYKSTITSITHKDGFNIVYRIFFEALTNAVKETHVKVNLVAPMLRDSDDIRWWKIRLEYEFRDIDYMYKPDFAVMLETETAIDYIEDYVKTDFNVIGLNDLTEEITDDYNRYDFMPIKAMKDELFNYLQYAHQHMRRTGIRLRHLISGNMLTNKEVFQRFINAGFINYIVPLSNIRLAESLLSHYEETRGRFKGVAKRRREAREKKQKEQSHKS